MTAWKSLARDLAAQLSDEGSLRSQQWRAAIEDTPRHLFVPAFYEQDSDRGWRKITADDPRYLARVYRNDPLMTALADTPSGAMVAVSSSSKPGLMARMLDALGVSPQGSRVLEIGTGTGYNAALLCHRLGYENVFSIDIDPGLVRLARDRLGRLGYRPILASGNGAEGLLGAAPFDRIIATCSVPAIPVAWRLQLDESGAMLVDFKRSDYGGNLILLRRRGETLIGRFLPKWAGFMAMRHAQAPPEIPGIGADRDGNADGEESRTALEPYPWSALVPWFLAHTEFPEDVGFGYRGFTNGQPEWACVTGRDGSWAHVRIAADHHGRVVRQGGPVKLWDAYERAHEQWVADRRPDWSRFGLTVTPGKHVVWLDDPDGTRRWNLN